jgi:asparagine synthase (glutamine-hydrolysing)
LTLAWYAQEAYYVRSIFESFYPHQTCIETVPGGFSVACSTAKAVEWDEEWKAAAAAVLSLNPKP